MGIDGSELSRAAFAYGAMIAEAAGVEILAIHAVESPSGERPARATIDECDAQCRARGVDFGSRIVAGPLLDRLLECGPTDLLALGKGRFAQAGFGSTTRRLMRHAPCPVLIAAGGLRPINRVVGAFDGGPGSHRAIAVCDALARRTGWPLSVLAVAGRLSLAEALQAAQDAAPEAQVIAWDAEGRLEAAQIEFAAAHARFGLMVVPAYSDSWLAQLLGGGMTGHLLAHLDAPLVLVH